MPVTDDVLDEKMKSASNPCVQRRPSAPSKHRVVWCYLAVAAAVVGMWPEDPTFSYNLFIASCVQLLALVSLIVKVRATHSVAGLSSQTFSLFAMSISARSFSNMLNEGYLPVDESGDLAYVLVEFLSFCCVCYILHLIHWTHASTYDAECDTFAIAPLVVSCVVAAYSWHPTLNRDELFDSVWAFSLNVEAFQLLPQLFMMVKVGGRVERTQAHFVANHFLAAVLRTAFWVWAIPGCPELSSPRGGYSWDMEVGGVYILVAHALQFLVLFDFMFHYLVALKNGSAVLL